VTRTGSTRVEQLTAAVEALRTARAPILGVVLNRVPKRGLTGESGPYGNSYGSYAPHRADAPASMPPVPSMSSMPSMPPVPSMPPTPAPSRPPLDPSPADAMLRPGTPPTVLPRTVLPRTELVDLRQPAGHGSVSALANGSVNGPVSPYQQAPRTRPHGRRSATPPDPQP
jgi:hypothetical protein